MEKKKITERIIDYSITPLWYISRTTVGIPYYCLSWIVGKTNIQNQQFEQFEKPISQNSSSQYIELTQQNLIKELENLPLQQENIKFQEVIDKQNKFNKELNINQTIELINEQQEPIQEVIINNENQNNTQDQDQNQLQHQKQIYEINELNNQEINQNQNETMLSDSQQQSEIHENNENINENNNEVQPLQNQIIDQNQNENFDQNNNENIDQNNNQNIDQNENNQQLQQYNLISPQILEKMHQIINASYKGRYVELQYQAFVGEKYNQNQLIEYYCKEQKLKFKNKVKKSLNGYQRVRGDGNCFYTAFTFQYLLLLLEDQQRKEQFIQDIKLLTLNIKYNEIIIENDESIIIQFLQIFNQIQSAEQLHNCFKDTESLFYIMSIIIMRNYIQKIYDQDQEMKQLGGELKDNLLTWEMECNNNEIVTKSIAQYLKLQIIVHFIDSQNSSYLQQVYGESNQKINLILKPGHYQIAIV